MPSVTLQPVVPTQHRALVRRWIESDHVSRWWGDPVHGLAMFDATPAHNHALIVHGGKPVGYVRWETVSLEALAAVGLVGIPEGFIDIDILIGEPSSAGIGVGPRALDALFDHFRKTTEAPVAGLCTSVDNHRANAAFRKAGCEILTQYDDPDYGPSFVFIKHLQ